MLFPLPIRNSLQRFLNRCVKVVSDRLCKIYSPNGIMAFLLKIWEMLRCGGWNAAASDALNYQASVPSDFYLVTQYS